MLEASIRTLHRYLADHLPWAWRITIADNASTDGTWAVARRLAAELPRVRAVHLDRKGRGLALKTVWAESDADVVAYMDVDLSTDLDALLPLVAPLVSGHSDLATGSRLDGRSRVVRGPKRELISRCYNTLLHLVLRTRFRDAQCGFKAGRRTTIQALLPAVQDNGWFFDTELLVAAERAGLRIHEVPVDWVDDPDSRVDVWRTAVDDLKGVWRVLRHRRVPEIGGAPRPPRGHGRPAAALRRRSASSARCSTSSASTCCGSRWVRGRPTWWPSPPPWCSTPPPTAASPSVGGAARTAPVTTSRPGPSGWSASWCRRWPWAWSPCSSIAVGALVQTAGAPGGRRRRHRRALRGPPVVGVPPGARPLDERRSSSPSTRPTPARRAAPSRLRRRSRPARGGWARIARGRVEDPAWVRPSLARPAPGDRHPLPLGPRRLRLGQRLLLGRRAGRVVELEGLLLRFLRRRQRHHRRQAAGLAVGHVRCRRGCSASTPGASWCRRRSWAWPRWAWCSPACGGGSRPVPG